MVPRVLVVGSVNVDLMVRLPHLPRWGQTVGGGLFSVSQGGKGGNQAVAAARLGADVRLVAAVGEDDYGRAARAELQREGVDLGLVRTVAEPTGVAVVLVDATGENLIAAAPGANGVLTPEAVDAAAAVMPAGPAVVLASLEVPLPAVEAAARLASARGWPFVLNPAPARPLPARLLAGTTVLTPNETEVAEVAPSGPGSLLTAGVDAVVVTRGAAGAVVHDAQGETPVPAPPVHAVDTTGAGDGLSGALAWALGSGLAVREAAEVAVAAASLSTLASGARAAYPTRGRLEAALGRSIA